MNDNTTNVFEYGKTFLAYLLYHSAKAGTDLTSSVKLSGVTYETGRLHHLLEAATAPVMRMYVSDMRATDLRIKFSGKSPTRDDNNISPVGPRYQVKGLEATAASLTRTTYVMQVTDPSGYCWRISKRYKDLQLFHIALCGARELSVLAPLQALPVKTIDRTQSQSLQIQQQEVEVLCPAGMAREVSAGGTSVDPSSDPSVLCLHGKTLRLPLPLAKSSLFVHGSAARQQDELDMLQSIVAYLQVQLALFFFRSSTF